MVRGAGLFLCFRRCSGSCFSVRRSCVGVRRLRRGRGCCGSIPRWSSGPSRAPNRPSRPVPAVCTGPARPW
nr:MAG TPA: hypothetical protein [Caudoviricetes sp.]